MKCASLVVLLVGIASFGCGGLVVGDAREDPGASGESKNSQEAGRENLSQSDGTTSDVLFACEWSGGEWPEPHPSRLVVEHVGGTTFRVNGEAFAVASVQKHGPWQDIRVTYRLLAANGWEYWLHGLGAPFEAMQLTLFKNPEVRTEATTSWWVCPLAAQWAIHLRDHPSALPSEFADARLDALVTATGGKRFRF